MTTIDKLDIAVHVQYAQRTEMVENIRREYRLEEAGAVEQHALTVALSQQMSEMDLLLGVMRTYAPWAYFYPPKKYFNQRRPAFVSYRVAPSLGSLEKQQSDTEKLENVKCKNAEEEEERSILSGCLAAIEEINDLIGFVVGRIGQFLQG